MEMRPWAVAAVLTALSLTGAPGEESAGTVPIIYTTDLYHPHDDPDDHFDLATLFALPEFDIRAIVIDTGARGAKRPGTVPIQQMMHLTGRTVPYATGLTANLEAPEDTGEAQPHEAQAGVELILNTLRNSTQPVTIFTTGSLRDVAAAYNRAPQLFKEKLGRLYVNAGHSAGGQEWNVKLDPHAFVRILRSHLPTYWVPCFGEKGFQSLWSFKHRAVLEGVPIPLQNFFLYALTKADPQEAEPLAVLTAPVSEKARARWWDKKRNMWCTAAFVHAARRQEGPFGFKKMPVRVTDEGKTTFVTEGDCVFVWTFRYPAPIAYNAFMTGALRSLLAGMPLAVEAEPAPAEPAPAEPTEDDGT